MISHMKSWPSPPSTGNRTTRGSSYCSAGLVPPPCPLLWLPLPQPPNERRPVENGLAGCLHASGRDGQRLETPPTMEHHSTSSSASGYFGSWQKKYCGL